MVESQPIHYCPHFMSVLLLLNKILVNCRQLSKRVGGMKVFPGIITFIAEHFLLEFTCFISNDTESNGTFYQGETNGIRTYYGSQISTIWYPNGSELYSVPDENCFEEEEYLFDQLTFSCPYFEESQSWTDLFQKIECNEQNIDDNLGSLMWWLENIYQYQCEQSKSLK